MTEAKTKPKLNLHFTAQFNVYIREGVGTSETLTLNAHLSNTGSTAKFNLYIRWVGHHRAQQKRNKKATLNQEPPFQ